MTTVASRKQKGRSGQAEIVAILKERFGFNDEDCYSRPASVNGDDIVLSPTAIGQFPYSVEVKRQEKISIWKWLEQAKENTKFGHIPPLVVFRRNKGSWYVCLEFSIFLDIISSINSFVRSYDALDRGN